MEPGDYNTQKDCEKCEKTICIECIGITGCQTTWGVCKECFDYKCVDCGVADLHYLDDMCFLVDDDPSPRCDKCNTDYS